MRVATVCLSAFGLLSVDALQLKVSGAALTPDFIATE